MDRDVEIIIAGFGGQGVMLAGYLLGRAATIYEGKQAVFQESYGPEARGSACKANLKISDEEIDYPIVESADFLIALSKEGYELNEPLLKKNGIVVYDSSLVPEVKKEKSYSIEATAIAEELQNRIVANMVISGFFLGVTKLLKKESVERAIDTGMAKRFVELNTKAFEVGYSKGEEIAHL
jgi:2-oxoglutarate ferredoxin oxidoreductase subunit gamma